MDAAQRAPGIDKSLFGLAELGPDLYSLHGAAGEALHTGANAATVLGRTSQQLLGQGFLTSVNVQDRVAVAKALNECFAAGIEASVQFRMQNQPGGARAVRWYELRCTRAPASMLGEAAGDAVVAVTRDVTERRWLEDDLRNSRAKAESASVAKGLFLANMSHELRTPLNAILGFSELLQSDAMSRMPPERHREYVELIHNSASHLLNVLNDILDMSKIEAGKYEIVAEPFSIGQTIRSCCAMLRGQAEQKQIDIACAGLEDLPEVCADERAIKQVMINLLSNAVKFTQEGGRVAVEAMRVGRNVRISVADNGIGISPEHMESLGKPFYQADSRYDRKYQGTGLGLSVVRGLLDLHDAKLSFSSKKGQGTTVVVTLPINAAEARPVPAAEQFELVRLHPNAQAEARKVFSIARQATLKAQEA